MCSGKSIMGLLMMVLFSVNGWGQEGAIHPPLTMPHYGAGEPDVVAFYPTTTLDDGEIVPWFLIEEVVVRAVREWKSKDERLQYFRLKRNVLRVLPYAIYAQKRYDQLHRELALASSRREERRLVKACEAEIKEKINTEVKNLSVSQGKILIKLIERQTGHTSYDLVKDMKGGITAFVYQGVARLFGHNLKSTYDPQEDFMIENIIREYEVIRPINKPYQ
ncbi:DUF4294 domain-containing protein [Sphingobacterium sp. SGG-5]|uniref:DUF4294 domain-containing protein n=1 Tax=Sphingobacterium sp. SGG-5 TaxID=2710881 RepID=UPI001F10E04C|nr:DUF4294 domain-containing protein [Sphingobacterium sp. SGG-5]